MEGGQIALFFYVLSRRTTKIVQSSKPVLQFRKVNRHLGIIKNQSVMTLLKIEENVKAIKHCKNTYQVVVPYTDETNTEVISVNGNEYLIERLPRPTNTVSELMCVFVSGVRYASFAKFLKHINN
jgi:hypothetical protein